MPLPSIVLYSSIKHTQLDTKISCQTVLSQRQTFWQVWPKIGVCLQITMDQLIHSRDTKYAKSGQDPCTVSQMPGWYPEILFLFLSVQ